MSAALWMRREKFTRTTEILWRKRGDTATLSVKEGQPRPLPGQAFIGFNLHRNTGRICKAHQSLSGSNDQTIDNIQRTLRAYLESGSDS